MPANRYTVKIPLNTRVRIDTCTLSHHSAFTVCRAIVMQSVYTGYCESETLPLFSYIINLYLILGTACIHLSLETNYYYT